MRRGGFSGMSSGLSLAPGLRTVQRFSGQDSAIRFLLRDCHLSVVAVLLMWVACMDTRVVG